MIQIFSRTVGMMGVNAIFIVKDNKAIAIDAGDDALRLATWVEKQGWLIERVVLTHGHFDHCAEVSKFMELLSAKSLLSDKFLYLHESDQWLYENLVSQGRMFGLPLDPGSAPLKNLQAGDELILAGSPIEILHTPGHSPGSLSYHIPEINTVVVGDVLFQRSIGRTDLWKSDHADLIKSIKDKLFILPENCIVYPGHGGTTTIGEEKRENPFLS